MAKVEDIRIEKIEKKVIEKGHEAGSGSIGIFGGEMRTVDVYYFVINGRKFKANEEVYKSVEPGTEVRTYYNRKQEVLKIEISCGDKCFVI